MRCLVIGYGSIGQRHARILQDLGHRVAVLSNRKVDFPHSYYHLDTALIREVPDYIIVANQTSQHYKCLEDLAKCGFEGNVLVEKPIFHRLQNIPNHNFKQIYVGYNLRFHPIIRKITEFIKGDSIIYTQVYVGQYLPYWRPNQDYRRSYSAKKGEGGGVLFDLSHDLDYLRWLYQDWHSMVAIGGRYSSLDIDSDDMYSLMLTMTKCPVVQIHLNYLDRISRRELTIITEKYTIKADLVKQRLQVNDALIEYKIDRDDTYRMQHQAIISGQNHMVCTQDEGLKVLEMVAAAEQSSKEGKWVTR